MKKLTALLSALLLLLSLAACGKGGEAALTRGGMPEAEGLTETEAQDGTAAGQETEGQGAPAVTRPETVDWDLAICQPEEAYREVEHYNTDPDGYRGMSLRLTGEFYSAQSHGRTIYYCAVRDDDGCTEPLELRFPGDGSLPEGFPAEGSMVTLWGVLDCYDAGSGVKCAVLTDARLSRVQGDGRD